MNKYDLCFVGSGPSTIFGILWLKEHNYKGNILIIEQGQSLHKRPKTEPVIGFSGACGFSDFKLSSALDVGGIIPSLTAEQLEKYEQWFINTLNKYCEDNLEWQQTTEYNIPKGCNLTWNKHKTLHVGSDRGSELCKKIENQFCTDPFITIKFEEEVLDVEKIKDIFIVSTNKADYQSNKVIIATGRFGMLASKLATKFNFNQTPRPLQLGIRVKDITNTQYEDIIKANYDFKFVKEYKFDNNVKVRVRTFCCNSSRAQIAIERNKQENYISFNGHALHKGETNPSVNYGIVAEATGLCSWYYKKENGSELIRQINDTKEFANNFDKEGNLGKGRKLLDDFSCIYNKNKAIRNIYPTEIKYALTDFISELQKVIDLSKARYYFPEWKASASHPFVSDNGETELSGLYYIGDCCLTGSIQKAVITSLMFCQSLVDKN